MMMKVAACDYIPYLIFVTNATDGVRVNFFLAGVNFTDLTRKIGNLLCKLAFYCVNFGVNFIFQKLYKVNHWSHLPATCMGTTGHHCMIVQDSARLCQIVQYSAR